MDEVIDGVCRQPMLTAPEAFCLRQHQRSAIDETSMLRQRNRAGSRHYLKWGNYMNSLLRDVIAAALTIALPNLCIAANDCSAVIKIKSQSKAASGWVLIFDVRTKCATSTGRFVYSYVDDKSKTVERRSPSWTPSDGMNFTLKDEIAEPGGLKSLTILPNSVESTKSP